MNKNLLAKIHLFSLFSVITTIYHGLAVIPARKQGCTWYKRA